MTLFISAELGTEQILWICKEKKALEWNMWNFFLFSLCQCHSTSYEKKDTTGCRRCWLINTVNLQDHSTHKNNKGLYPKKEKKNTVLWKLFRFQRHYFILTLIMVGFSLCSSLHTDLGLGKVSPLFTHTDTLWKRVRRLYALRSELQAHLSVCLYINPPLLTPKPVPD